MAEPTPGTALHADCASCFGLCCVAMTLTRGADFAFDKPAGRPCLHLVEDAAGDAPAFGCDIHAELRPRGMPGCTTYDCFGAGQRVARQTYGGTSWREAPDTAGQMFRVFGVVRALHEMLWLLDAAAALPTSASLRDDLVAARDRIDRVAGADPDALDGADVDAHRDAVAPLLRQAADLARAAASGPRRELAGADLAGRDLRDADLRGAGLRGALLIGADLRGADLTGADLTGADLRGTDVRGADLRRALFLTRMQVSAARGDRTTLLPPGLDRPPHWR